MNSTIRLTEHSEWIQTMARLTNQGIMFTAYKECGEYIIELTGGY